MAGRTLMESQLETGAPDHAGILRCPHCHGSLQRLGRTLRCVHGHSFDIARRGYVNLLPSAHRHSKDPGDNREMILARRRFLDGGFFDPIADAVTGAVAAALVNADGEAKRSVLDAGAGEGYYLARLRPSLSSPTTALYGVDISRHAVQFATHRSKEATWLVASIVDLPVTSASVDVILSVFSPLAPVEFQRVLRPTGTLIIVAPGPRHLYSLRQHLYPEVFLHESEQFLATLATAFAPVSESLLRYEIELPTRQHVSDLLTMTPFGWNVDQARREAAEAGAPLRTAVEVIIRHLRPLPAP